MTLEHKSKPMGVRILLGLVAFSVTGGMVYLFIPALSSKGQAEPQSKAIFKINGEEITLAEAERLKKGNPLFAISDQKTVVGDDVKQLLTGILVQQAAITHETAGVDVTTQEVSDTVTRIRKDNKLEDTQKWIDFLAQRGYTDATVRQEIRKSLQSQKKVDQVRKDVKVTDAEVRAYYDVYSTKYQTEPKVMARQIQFKDKTKAEAALKKIRAGADFVKVAGESGAKDGGQVSGGKMVTALAFPGSISQNVMGLSAGQVSDVLIDGQTFYIVKVEKKEAAKTRPFDEVKAEVSKQVLSLKQAETVEAWQASLIQNPKIDVIDKDWNVWNPVVAKVGDQEIHYFELLIRLYGNQQLQQMLQGGSMDPNMLNTVFKPQILDGIVREKLARAIVAKEKLPLVGPANELVTALGFYKTRDLKVKDSDVKDFYQKNIKDYTLPGNADLTEASFATRAEAEQFRKSFLSKKGANFTQAVSDAGGTANELGAVANDDSGARLSTAVVNAVFKGTVQTAGNGSLTDVVEVKSPEVTRYVVAYATEFIKPRVQPFAEVQDSVKALVEGQARQKASEAYFAKMQKDFSVQNLLKAAVDEQAKRVPQVKTPATPATPVAPTSPK